MGSSSLQILSAMITPAVLISACGTLILSTSNRLGRASDRVRRFSDRMRELSKAPLDDADAQAERLMLFRLLPKLMRRVRLIHLSLMAFYFAVGLFVFTSLVIGGTSALDVNSGLLPLLLGLAGASVLCYGAALLTIEAQLSLEVNMGEMEFIRELGAHHAPPNAQQAVPQPRFRRRLRRAAAPSRKT